MCNVLGPCLRFLDSCSKNVRRVFIVPINNDPFYAILTFLAFSSPGFLVPYFPVLHFHVLHFCATFSSLAFSSPAVLCRIFHSCIFQPCIFPCAAFSCLAFSVAPFGRNSLNRPSLRIAQQYQHNLYISDKYFHCATIPSLTMKR